MISILKTSSLVGSMLVAALCNSPAKAVDDLLRCETKQISEVLGKEGIVTQRPITPLSWWTRFIVDTRTGLIRREDVSGIKELTLVVVQKGSSSCRRVGGDATNPEAVRAHDTGNSLRIRFFTLELPLGAQRMLDPSFLIMDNGSTIYTGTCEAIKL